MVLHAFPVAEQPQLNMSTRQVELGHQYHTLVQVILWKSADQQGPSHFDFTNYIIYGCKIVDELPTPVYDTDVPAPAGLIDILSCMACSTTAYSCHKTQISCTVYCGCKGQEECKNPFLHVLDDGNEE